MPSYLVESHLPRSARERALAAGGRVRAACEALSRDGTPARYVRTTFVPEDETCFHLVEARSAELAGEVCRRAELGSVRIVEASEARAARP